MKRKTFRHTLHKTNIFSPFFKAEHTQETNSPHSLKKDVENMGKGKEKF